MFLQIRRKLHDTKNQLVEFLGHCLTREILVYYLRKVGELVDQIGVMVNKVRYHHPVITIPCKELVEIREDLVFLSGKMFKDFFLIVGEEGLEYRTIALAGMLCHTDKMAFYMRKTLIDIVLMGGHKIRHEMLKRCLVEYVIVGIIVVEGIDIKDEKDKIDRLLIMVANLLNALFAKTQRYAEPRHDKYEVVVGGYHVGHLHPTSKKNIFHAANIHKKNGLAPPLAKLFCQRAGIGLQRRGLAGLYW
jgi:hypothetical protein